MKRIELTDIELKVLKRELKHEFSTLTATKEEIEALVRVLNKVEDLEFELNAFEESGDNPALWFYKKYKQQQKELGEVVE